MSRRVRGLHAELTQEVFASPTGSKIGALFDLDGTIIAGYSALTFIREQQKRGDFSASQFADIMLAFVNFGAGRIDFADLMAKYGEALAGVNEAEFRKFARKTCENKLFRNIYPETRALIKAHLKQGHTVAIISSATVYQIEAIAEELGIKHIKCSAFEVKDGVFTGNSDGEACFGHGKVNAANELADELGIDLDNSWFYSDSYDDIELLRHVGLPRALNPNKELEKTANREGWPVRHFSSRGRPGISDVVRSIAATGSLVTSVAAGLPIWGLTGSMRKAQNFSLSLFADTASALAGIELDVINEHYLWSHRPAVFVINHQSMADVIIASRLLRRDFAGVAKKESRDIPLVGRAMELAGIVLIDRQNAASAIETLRPLVDMMKNEGVSVAIAPEGTRTVSEKLNPFKKGAFHLAMQAQVPMIPIVIKNAMDVAPKGDFIYHPGTVEVEILPPVDTRSWAPETVDQHVAEVRGLFLEALGQTETHDASPSKASTSPKKAARKKPVAKKAPAKKKTPGKKKAVAKAPSASKTA